MQNDFEFNEFSGFQDEKEIEQISFVANHKLLLISNDENLSGFPSLREVFFL
jgi:hypothetical protein